MDDREWLLRGRLPRQELVDTEIRRFVRALADVLYFDGRLPCYVKRTLRGARVKFRGGS